MADGSKIEWTDATWNPIRVVRPVALPGAAAGDLAESRKGWHCEKVSPGCANCYAEPINRRLGTGLDYKPGHRADVRFIHDETALRAPLRWRRPRMIFVGSMTDLFADFVTDALLDQIFAVMALCPQHVFQLLTKRPERMKDYVVGLLSRRAGFDCRAGLDGAPWPLPNVWLGVSVEDQRRADERIPLLIETPAAVRWISAEPLLGPVDLTWVAQPDDDRDGVIDALLGCDWIDGQGRGVTYRPYRPGHQDRKMTREVVRVGDAKLDWVVAGGESGPNARPMHPDWARALRDQCAAAGVPFLFKQWGEFAPEADDSGVHPDAVYMRPDGGIPGEPRWPGYALGYDGKFYRTADEALATAPPRAFVRRAGKKAAGRTLDGVTHDVFPERRP